MYTKAELINHLREMGLKPDDAVMIHSSLKSIGPVEGGADTVLDALMEYFAPGLLMLPTHTWKQMNPDYNIFDPATEPACVGILPNLFMKRPGVIRSLHPTHSIAAYGPKAAEYVAGEENCTTPCTPGGYRKTTISMTGSSVVKMHFASEGEYADTVETVTVEMVKKERSPFWVALGDTKLEHFLNRKKFEAAESGWYYSQSKRAVLVKYPNPKKETTLTVSFEDFDLIGM